MATLVVVWSWSESPTLCAACACTPLTSAFSQRCPIESSYAPCPTLGRTHDMHMMQPTLTSAVRLHPTYVASLSSYSFSNANHGCCWHRCIWGERFCFFVQRTSPPKCSAVPLARSPTLALALARWPRHPSPKQCLTQGVSGCCRTHAYSLLTR